MWRSDERFSAEIPKKKRFNWPSPWSTVNVVMSNFDGDLLLLLMQINNVSFYVSLYAHSVNKRNARAGRTLTRQSQMFEYGHKWL